jgi:predicted nucleic acid-binding protein
MPEQIYFDSNIFIYAMEDDEFGLLARRWLAQVDRGEILCVTSEMTFAEILPHPIEHGKVKLIDGYHRLLSGTRQISVVPADRAIFIAAAELRAKTRASLPDAVHVATAIASGCQAFLTEDARVRATPLRELRLADAKHPL